MSYTVTAKRWELGWELHIDEIGVVTQTRTLANAATAAREVIALALDIDDADVDSIDVDIVPDIDGIPGLVAAVKRDNEAAAQAQRDAAEKQRRLVQKMLAGGMHGSEIAAVLKVSPQRVSQLRAPAGIEGKPNHPREQANPNTAIGRFIRGRA